ncbi:MAG TPA: hypothetical protein VE398_19865 [Acidobacteriota bacterium]|nr:hypothetical protein [Acidobacteriota bacterium]
MQASQELREKLVLVIGNLICRCIEEARKVPYILDQEEVVRILVENPRLFEKLVRDEQLESTEFSKEKLTARLDTLRELGQFEALDTWDMSFSGRIESNADLAPILKQVNQLSRTFAVYVSNTLAIFEREFELFMEKFHQSLQRAGVTARSMELTTKDLSGLARRAEPYLTSGQFLQAFSFDRLLNSQVITKDAIIVPSPGYSFKRDLMQGALKDVKPFSPLVKFILRVSYISQGTWNELFDVLVNLVDTQPGRFSRAELIDLIQQDIIFTCNLLCEPLANIKDWSPAKRSAAIEKKLTAGSRDTGRT